MNPAEFIAEEDINQLVDGSKVSEGVSCKDKAVKTINLLSTRQQGVQLSSKQQVDQIGSLTFSPTPLLDNEDLQEISTSADDNQAELMQWHFCLGHLPFNQLKELAKMVRYKRCWQKRSHHNVLIVSLVP